MQYHTIVISCERTFGIFVEGAALPALPYMFVTALLDNDSELDAEAARVETLGPEENHQKIVAGLGCTTV